MFHRGPTSSERPLRLASLVWSAWLCAASSCAEAAPADADLLSSLSTGQLRALCAELPSAWAEAGTLGECDNGTTGYALPDGLSACGSRRSECTASVAQWRACMGAYVADSCQALEQEPVACVALRSAAGCDGIVLPLGSVCTPPSWDTVAAFEGVYGIFSHTKNELGCELEGAALPATGHLALATTFFPGITPSPLHDTPMLMLQDCSSVETCQQRMAELLSASVPVYALSAGEQNAELPGVFVCGPDRSGALSVSRETLTSGEVCEATSRETVLRREPDGSLRIELRALLLPTAAEGQQCRVLSEPAPRCVSLTVWRAERVAPL